MKKYTSLIVLASMCAIASASTGSHSYWIGTVEISDPWVYDYDYAKIYVWGSDSVFIVATDNCYPTYPSLIDEYKTNTFWVDNNTNLWTVGVCQLMLSSTTPDSCVATITTGACYSKYPVEYDFFFNGSEDEMFYINEPIIPETDSSLESTTWGSIKASLNQ